MTSNPFSGMSDEELLRRAREGDRAAWDALISRHHDFLATVAEQQVPEGAPGGIRPSDVAQESAMKALRTFSHLSQVKGSSKGELEKWLRTVVDSSLLDMLRKARAEKRDDAAVLSLDSSKAEKVPASQPSPSQVSAQRESWHDLIRHFYELPDDQRDALSLLHFQQRPMSELMNRFDRSEDAVESLLRRGVRRLRARMEGSSADEVDSGTAASHVRTNAALSAYFRRRETEASFDLEAFIADFPDCADELRALLGWLEKLRNLKPPTEE